MSATLRFRELEPRTDAKTPLHTAFSGQPVALIMLLSTVIGVAGMAVSGWLVLGVQGSAHAINKAGSLRMQSYRLLASVPLSQADDVLLKEMEQTAFSPELADVADRDGQQQQLRELQYFWRTEVAPALKQAQQPDAVADKITTYVNRSTHWSLHSTTAPSSVWRGW